MKRFVYRRGSVSKAAEEAFILWISMVSEDVYFDGDPVEAIDRLSDINIDSVSSSMR